MTGKRNFAKKRRDIASKNPRPVLLIVSEGDNVTESQYFRSFQKQNSAYTIRMVIAKHITNPEGMLSALQKKWRELELDERKGDAAYIVLDLDCNENKAKIIKLLSQKSKNIRFVVSNPCFEVWFLLHFRYSTKSYINSDAAISELREYVPEYEKRTDVFPIIFENTDVAVKHTEQLSKYYEELGYEWPSNERNPFTDVPVIIHKFNIQRGDEKI